MGGGELTVGVCVGGGELTVGVWVCVCTYVHMYMCLYVYVSVYVCMSMCVYTMQCTYVYRFAGESIYCMYVCMYVHVYTHVPCTGSAPPSPAGTRVHSRAS